jgi:DNA-binding NtrC family response regulator
MMRNPDRAARVLVGTRQKLDAPAAEWTEGDGRDLRVAFEQGDFDTCVVDNGREVVRIVEHGGIDLVVLDVELAPMGGLRTLRLLRDIDHWLPVILASRAWTRHLLSEALHLEASSVLRIPVQMDVLFETVRKLLTEKQT